MKLFLIRVAFLVFLVLLLKAPERVSVCFYRIPFQELSSNETADSKGMVEEFEAFSDAIIVDTLKLSWECRRIEVCRGIVVWFLRQNTSIQMSFSGSDLSDCFAKSPRNCIFFMKYATKNHPRCEEYTNQGDRWIVIQRRMDGSVDFNRGWKDYDEGFGTTEGELWIGNRVLHKLTSSNKYKLLISLEDYEGTVKCALYSTFSVGSEKSHYTLHLDGFRGNAGDSLLDYNNKPFSTYDSGPIKGKCPFISQGGWWWYKGCLSTNLNGHYLKGEHSKFVKGVTWQTFRGFYYSLKFAEMKISRVHK